MGSHAPYTYKAVGSPSDEFSESIVAPSGVPVEDAVYACDINTRRIHNLEIEFLIIRGGCCAPATDVVVKVDDGCFHSLCQSQQSFKVTRTDRCQILITEVVEVKVVNLWSH